MSTSSTSTTTAEPEENIEAALVTLLASVCTIPVEGAITPATTGTVKRLSADTFVSVAVDLASTNLDFVGPNVPCDFTATITAHCALADSANGSLYRDTCRAIRAALLSLAGDGCTSLGADGFACDEALLTTTTTSFEAGDNPVQTKAYAVTLKGRVTSTTTTEA